MMITDAKNSSPAPSQAARGLRAQRAVEHGFRIAKDAGCQTPSLRDAVWELLLEAADTLQRLPNRERGWLTATSRAHWPAFVHDLDAAFSDPGGKTPRADPLRHSRAPATAEAIDRMDLVLIWLPHAGGKNARRDLAVLFGLACGIKVATLRRRFGCGRRTIYDIRDRALGRLCAWLAEKADSGQG